MGEMTAFWYAAQHPTRISCDVVIAPIFEMAARLLLSLGWTRAQEWRTKKVIRIQTGLAEFDLGYQLVEDELRYPTVSLMRRLKTPSLILHGSDDEVVPCQLSRQFVDRIEQVNLAEIPGGDHRLTAHKERLFELMWDFVGPAPDTD